MSTLPDKRITEHAMDVLREGKEGREADLAADVILIRAENARLRKVIHNIDITCEEGGDYPLFFSHVAHFLRQDGFAQGPEMDDFFKGTSLEKRA